MELELKHIAPYLPYGVEYACNMSFMPQRNEDWQIRGSLTYLEDLNGVNKIDELLKGETITKVPIKLALRPLSELKDDVKFRQLLVDQLNDETFKLHYVDDVKQLSLITSSGHRELIYLMNEVCGECSYMIYQFMVEKKFDLFNIIPQGLAVDSTTLKQRL